MIDWLCVLPYMAIIIVMRVTIYGQCAVQLVSVNLFASEWFFFQFPWLGKQKQQDQHVM